MKVLTFESAQRQGTSNLVGTSARGYSGNAIPIMVSPDNGNATCNGISPVANDKAVLHYYFDQVITKAMAMTWNNLTEV